MVATAGNAILRCASPHHIAAGEYCGTAWWPSSQAGEVERLTPSHCGRRVLQPGVVAVLAIEVDDEERQIPKINKKSMNCYQQDSIHESSDL